MLKLEHVSKKINNFLLKDISLELPVSDLFPAMQSSFKCPAFFSSPISAEYFATAVRIFMIPKKERFMENCGFLPSPFP